MRKGHFIITFIDLFIAFFFFRYGGVCVWGGGGGETAVLLLQFCGLCLSCDWIKWWGRERCFFVLFTTFIFSFFSFIGERE